MEKPLVVEKSRVVGLECPCPAVVLLGKGQVAHAVVAYAQLHTGQISVAIRADKGAGLVFPGPLEGCFIPERCCGVVVPLEKPVPG